MKDTSNHGLLYSGPSLLLLLSYSDADFGGDIDDYRSRTGYVYTLGETTIAWGCHRQGSTAASTTHAELVACAEAVRCTDWLVHLLHDLDTIQTLPITVFCDNQAIIQLLQNPDYLNCTKHQDLKYFYIKDVLAGGGIVFQYIHPTAQLVDIFTKPLPRDQHIKLSLSIGLHDFSDNKWERCVI